MRDLFFFKALLWKRKEAPAQALRGPGRTNVIQHSDHTPYLGLEGASPSNGFMGNWIQRASGPPISHSPTAGMGCSGKA